uniref:Uncharacterized protein n=1 Tax=mine drainage metagenome TaxID=410659 RepID=E6QP69_9ZZZZ
MIANILKILGTVATSLGILKQFGVNLGPVGNEALNILNDVPIDLTDFNNGQAVVLGTFTENGVPGTIVAVKNGGPAAASLGL